MYTLIMAVVMNYATASMQTVVVPNLSYQECTQAAKQFNQGGITVQSSLCVLQAEKK